MLVWVPTQLGSEWNLRYFLISKSGSFSAKVFSFSSYLLTKSHFIPLFCTIQFSWIAFSKVLWYATVCPPKGLKDVAAFAVQWLGILFCNYTMVEQFQDLFYGRQSKMFYLINSNVIKASGFHVLNDISSSPL